MGHIDVDAMIDIYRTSGSIPDGDWKAISNAYAEGKWQPAVGNASNALVVIMKPEDGIYMHCVGEARRGLAPMSAKNSSPLYDETNAFWEINLSNSLSNMLTHARQLAEQYIQMGLASLNQNDLKALALERMVHLLDAAQSEVVVGNLYLSESDDVYTRACALRAFTRAQVHAKQVVHAYKAPDAVTILTE